MRYELKLATGKVVEWEGADGVAAAHRYAGAHPGSSVVAWREPRFGFFPGVDVREIRP